MGVIWKKTISLDEINKFTKNSIVEKTGIQFIEKGDDFLRASMPVDERTKQPLGILHGGASVVLAETLGSMASHMTLDENHYSVGLEIKANHLKSISNGLVTGIVKPVNLGKTDQLWDITITDEDDKKICVSRITMVILKDLKKYY
ncbi:MAG: hotdog fold thioesterase [Thermodesulfobacteriota bacterium]